MQVCSKTEKVGFSSLPPRGDEYLQEYIRTTPENLEAPVYIFDHHHHAFFGWNEARAEGAVENGATLLHIDAHSDAGYADIPLRQGASLQEIANYTRTLSVHNFISPALQNGLIRNVYWVKYNYSNLNIIEPNTHEHKSTGIPQIRIGGKDMEQLLLSMTNPKRLIVDIDLDYFKKYDSEVDIEIIKRAIEKAGVVTMSTSPGFIPGERAIELANKLLKT
ncbi:MAG: hypothetical protein US86_C0012G0018 [Candidatus Daviesbacteria bacterium GW2011_GWA2_38_24]|uniref:Arginase n=1 Tax=Candidatus Daviesbacteria bacterium GW2011_GWA2_38_24 TaxID=1618422 RepID=A0A0G0JCD0_9BACT|nr:MAG: hypothetical protein US86_C0012G0018 [Candidatus Daviesbacteria bacterium GW2011_GWA2_38_24]